MVSVETTPAGLVRELIDELVRKAGQGVTEVDLVGEFSVPLCEKLAEGESARIRDVVDRSLYEALRRSPSSRPRTEPEIAAWIEENLQVCPLDSVGASLVRVHGAPALRSFFDRFPGARLSPVTEVGWEPEWTTRRIRVLPVVLAGAWHTTATSIQGRKTWTTQ